MSRLDEVIAATQEENFALSYDEYARDSMLEEIAISLAVIADVLTEMREEQKGGDE